MDSRVAPHITGLAAGVSRQAPLLRSPNQVQALDNILPSVDHGGLLDRQGTITRAVLPVAGYNPAGLHTFFRTSDGQRWVLLRRVEAGNFEVRNLATGEAAALTMSAAAQGYLAASGGVLKAATIADTTLLLNTGVTVTCTVPAKPALGAAYVFIRRVSSAKQQITVARSSGASAQAVLKAQNEDTRETAASNLATAIQTNPGMGVTAYTLGNAPYVVKLVGPPAVIAELSARNSWDESGVVFIKGSVAASTELPPAFDEGISIAVDQGRGDFKNRYYVRYSLADNAWLETSYLDADYPTATLDQNTLPVKLRQITPTSFAIDVCTWVQRKKGDDISNPLPYFVGKKVSEIASWRGRLILSSGDTPHVSQPDDIYNFWRETAREARASDAFALPCNAPELTEVYHVIPFRNKLIVTADNAQLEAGGDKPFTEEDASLAVATRYQIDKTCRPKVVGDALYYTGVAEGRSTLWEYSYSDAAGSNTSADLAKHVPGYVPGRPQKIVGSAQASRLFLWTPADPSSLFVHSGYWKDGQRAQSAWSRLNFPGVTAIWETWVDADALFLIARSATHLWLLEVPVESGVGLLSPTAEQRLDFQMSIPIAYNAALGRSEVTLPTGYSGLGVPLVLTVLRPGDDWVTDYPLTVAGAVAYVPGAIPVVTGTLGIRYERSIELSPFNSPDGERNTSDGIFQVHGVTLDILVSGDLKATVRRGDRPDAVMQITSRIVGQQAATPVLRRDWAANVPVNARGSRVSVTVATDSTAPLALTGYTPRGRYTTTST